MFEQLEKQICVFTKCPESIEKFYLIQYFVSSEYHSKFIKRKTANQTLTINHKVF